MRTGRRMVLNLWATMPWEVKEPFHSSLLRWSENTDLDHNSQQEQNYSYENNLKAEGHYNMKNCTEQ